MFSQFLPGHHSEATASLVCICFRQGMAVKILNILSFHGPVLLRSHKIRLHYTTCALFPQQIHTCIFFSRLTIYYPENLRLPENLSALGQMAWKLLHLEHRVSIISHHLFSYLPWINIWNMQGGKKSLSFNSHIEDAKV